MLTYRCPETDNIVRTSIKASQAQVQRLKGASVSLWCPHCQTGHKVFATDMTVVEGPS